jgi:exonuclease III
MEDTYLDDDCNILMIKLKIDDTTLTLGSIYGPNQDDELFFDRISSTIVKFGSDYVIIGGDWNTTYDSRNSRLNMDIINTVNIPSARRSLWLNQLCTDRTLFDPYRHFYPESREYTYIPYAAGATNRSRIDFF